MPKPHNYNTPRDNIRVKIPSAMRRSEEDGLLWIAGFVAQRMKSVDNSLGSYEFQKKDNTGNLKYSYADFLEEIAKSRVLT